MIIYKQMIKIAGQEITSLQREIDLFEKIFLNKKNSKETRELAKEALRMLYKEMEDEKSAFRLYQKICLRYQTCELLAGEGMAED